MGIENNFNNELSILDIISIVNFFISIKNLNENVSQGSVQEIIKKQTSDIHTHLNNQDKKIDEIIKRLEVIENANKGNIQQDNTAPNRRHNAP